MSSSPRIAIVLYAAALMLLQASPARSAEGQSEGSGSPLALLEALLGRWEGSGSGQFGEALVEKEYKRVMGGKYIVAEGRSHYAPVEGQEQGEEHEEFGVYSYDPMRELMVLRQFHIEGIVNQYTLAAISQDGRKLSFVTEAIEGIPAGWTARETLELIGEDEMLETFELAEQGAEFVLYSENRLRRVAGPPAAE